MQKENSNSSTPHRVVIVGGGAGGLELATKLGDKIGKKKRAQVTLVDCAQNPSLETVAARSGRRQHG